MKSLKELIARNIALSGRELSVEEADFVLTVLSLTQSDASKFEMDNNKLVYKEIEMDGLVTMEYVNGRLFKRTEMHPNGNKRSEMWFSNGEKHRENAPAEILWFENGNKDEEEWYKNGLKHRENGPAQTYWDANGNKTYEYWYTDGELNREDGPAITLWFANGRKYYEAWIKMGEFIAELNLL